MSTISSPTSSGLTPMLYAKSTRVVSLTTTSSICFLVRPSYLGSSIIICLISSMVILSFGVGGVPAELVTYLLSKSVSGSLITLFICFLSAILSGASIPNFLNKALMPARPPVYFFSLGLNGITLSTFLALFFSLSNCVKSICINSGAPLTGFGVRSPPNLSISRILSILSIALSIYSK